MEIINIMGQMILENMQCFKSQSELAHLVLLNEKIIPEMAEKRGHESTEW